MSEIPVHPRPRRLVDWINPTGAKKVHSLIDKVYKRKNLEMAWEMVKANRGSGGVDGRSLDGFAAQLDQQLDRSSSRCSMTPTSATGEGDRRRTPCVKYGRRFRAVGSGSWTRTLRTFWIGIHNAPLLKIQVRKGKDAPLSL